MPHNCCVPECRKKGYRTIVVDGTEVKVSFHTLPDETKTDLRKQWISAIRLDVGKKLASY